VEPLVDWWIANHASLAVRLTLISDASPEGAQFVRGFGGVGGLMRWRAAVTASSHAGPTEPLVEGEGEGESAAAAGAGDDAEAGGEEEEFDFM